VHGCTSQVQYAWIVVIASWSMIFLGVDSSSSRGRSRLSVGWLWFTTDERFSSVISWRFKWRVRRDYFRPTHGFYPGLRTQSKPYSIANEWILEYVSARQDQDSGVTAVILHNCERYCSSKHSYGLDAVRMFWTQFWLWNIALIIGQLPETSSA
jgi:hypothetical protein